jgi:hypothetical protein
MGLTRALLKFRGYIFGVTFDPTQGAPVEEPIFDPYQGAQGPQPSAPSPSRVRHRLLVFAAFISLFSTVGALALVGWGYWQWRHHLLAQQDQDGGDEDSSTKRTGLPADDPAESTSPTTQGSNDKPVPAVPDDTRVMRRGSIDVVDIGLSSPSLLEALKAQQRLAKAKGQRLLLMTTGSECSPCRGLDRSLDHPAMQQALAGVRLVRVDLKAFKEELGELRMPTNLYPAFFMLGPDLMPLDGIHGGEWDEDIADNIAPVLGPFVRGEYKQRRHEWSPTTGGVSL